MTSGAGETQRSKPPATEPESPRSHLIVRPWAASVFGVCLVLTFLAHSREVPAALRPIYNQPYGDKVVHVLLGCVLALLANLALSDARVRVHGLRFLLGSALVLLLLAAAEASQFLIPYRIFDPFDLASDILGILFAVRISALRELNRAPPAQP